MQTIKIGGALCKPDALAQLAKRWDGQPWAIVHGGGPQLDAVMKDSRRTNGLRHTTTRQADQVRDTLDEVGRTITRVLRDHGVPAIHIPAGARAFQAVVKRPDGKNIGRVGTVTDVDSRRMPDPMEHVLVLTPVGWDAEGPLNINADEGAAMAAAALKSDRFVMATSAGGVLDRRGRRLRKVSPAAARRMEEEGVIDGGMLPKLENAQLARAAGVGDVVIGPLDAAWDHDHGVTQILPMVEA